MVESDRIAEADSTKKTSPAPSQSLDVIIGVCISRKCSFFQDMVAYKKSYSESCVAESYKTKYSPGSSCGLQQPLRSSASTSRPSYWIEDEGGHSFVERQRHGTFSVWDIAVPTSNFSDRRRGSRMIELTSGLEAPKTVASSTANSFSCPCPGLSTSFPLRLTEHPVENLNRPRQIRITFSSHHLRSRDLAHPLERSAGSTA